MQITVNGDPRTVDEGATVAELVTLFKLTPERVAVEVNTRLVRRALFGETALHPDDKVEIVTLAGGG